MTTPSTPEELLVNVPIARIEVETPRLTIAAAFAHYQGDIEKLLRDALDKQLTDGTFAKAAMAEMQKQIPEFIGSQVRRALWETEIANVLTPVVQAAFRAVMERPKKPRKKP